MRRISLVLIVGALLLIAIAPVSAGSIVVTGANIQYPDSEVTTDSVNSYSYTAPSGQSVSIIEFKVPTDTEVSFTLFFGNGNSVEGGITYKTLGIMQSYSEVSLGGYEYNETFTDTYVSTAGIAKKVHFTSYAKDTSTTPNITGFATYAQGYGLYSNEIVFYPIGTSCTELANNMISGISFAATKPMILHIEAEDSDTLSDHICNTVGEARNRAASNALNILIDNLNSIWSAMTSITYWVRLFTLDNIVLVFVLYLLGTLTAAFAKQAVRKKPGYPRRIQGIFYPSGGVPEIIRLVLEADCIHPDSPSAGTPKMVVKL